MMTSDIDHRPKNSSVEYYHVVTHRRFIHVDRFDFHSIQTRDNNFK